MQRDNKLVSRRLDISKHERKPSEEKQILDWFTEKHVNKEKRQPKRLPTATTNEPINNRLLTSGMGDSLFGPSRMDIGRVPTQGTNFFRDHSPQQEVTNRDYIVLNEEATEEDLDQKALILESRLLEIKKNKERLNLLKQRNSPDDQREIKILTDVIQAQKKEAKNLLDDIKNTTRTLGTSNISLLI